MCDNTFDFVAHNTTQTQKVVLVRLKLRFKPESDSPTLPYNYQFPVASWIYGSLLESSEDYGSFLHDEGYEIDGKQFKLFTFSRLFINRNQYYTNRRGLCLRGRPLVSCYLSSPVEPFITHFAQGTFETSLVLQGNRLIIYDVETQEVPDLSSEMKLFALSPITMSTMKRVNGELKTYYMRPDDDFSVQIEKNLRRKYKLVHGECAPKGKLRFGFLPGAEKKSKLISYKNTRIKGHLAPFRISGPHELIEMGYEAGFGDKNSLGFGMAETPERFRRR